MEYKKYNTASKKRTCYEQAIVPKHRQNIHTSIISVDEFIVVHATQCATLTCCMSFLWTSGGSVAEWLLCGELVTVWLADVWLSGWQMCC